MAAKTAPKISIGVLILLVGGVILAFKSCSSLFERKPEWVVPIEADDAFTIASTILAHGKMRGCGDFQVTRQYVSLKQIEVKCGDGRAHTLTWNPVFKVDGSVPQADAWDQTKLAELKCVKGEDGRWLAAYVDAGKAFRVAEEQSTRTDKETRIYNASSTIYGVTTKRADGIWESIGSMDHLADPDERRGCELSADGR